MAVAVYYVKWSGPGIAAREPLQAYKNFVEHSSPAFSVGVWECAVVSDSLCVCVRVGLPCRKRKTNGN